MGKRPSPDHPVEEPWRVVAGLAPGRREDAEVTVFDAVGFAVGDFAALRCARGKLAEAGPARALDLVADPDDPRDLFGFLAGDALSG